MATRSTPHREANHHVQPGGRRVREAAAGAHLQLHPGGAEAPRHAAGVLLAEAADIPRGHAGAHAHLQVAREPSGAPHHLAGCTACSMIANAGETCRS